MEVGVGDEKYDKNERLDDEKEAACPDVPPPYDIEDFYDIFGDLDEHSTEDSIVWVNTKKTIWEGRVIKIPFNEKSEDAKHLKLI